MDKKLEQLRKAYQNVPIPKELDQVVETALQHKPKKKRRIVVWPASTLVAAAVLYQSRSSPGHVAFTCHRQGR